MLPPVENHGSIPPRAPARRPPVRHRADDPARRRAPAARRQFRGAAGIHAGLGPPRRHHGNFGCGRDLDRRDQVLAGGFPQRQQMARIPRLVRPAVLRHLDRHGAGDDAGGNRPHHRRQLGRGHRPPRRGGEHACRAAEGGDAGLRARRRTQAARPLRSAGRFYSRDLLWERASPGCAAGCGGAC